MRIESQYHIWATTPSDETRPVLSCVLVERVNGGSEGRAVASDGFCLAVVPITLDDGDKTGLIPAELFKQASKLAKGGEIVLGEERIEVPASKYQETFARPEQQGAFPDYRKILPKRLAGGPLTKDLTINPLIFSRVADALGLSKGLTGVRIWRGETETAPILIEPSDHAHWQDGTEPIPPYGILMPILKS